MAVIKYKDPITGEIKKVGTPIVDAYNKAETEEKLSSAIAQAENYTDRQVATLITENDARQLIEEALSGFQPEGGGGSDVTVSNSFAKVKVGTTTISADAINDTLILMAGNNVTLTPDTDNDSVTISATNTTYSAATTSANGLMTAAMVTKLNGIAAGANAYTHPTHTAKSSGLYKVTVDGNGHVSAATAVQKSDITALGIPAQDTTYGAASTSANGLMTTTMVSKLNGIATGANAYTHPSHTAKSSGLYKVTVDSSGHVSAATAVQKSDITALGIPAQDTTYSAASQSAAGLMSAADKKKLDGIATGANNYTYTLPTASSSTLGGVKTTSSVTSTSGLTACPIINGVVYYKEGSGGTTASLSSLGITATATELNYVDGVTSSIQTQLNNKLSSSSSGYIKSLSISGKTITYTRGDNTTGTLTTQDTTYTLPNASSSTLGGVKIGSNISVSSGTISLTSANVISALGYTPLSSAPVTSVNGETGNVSVKVINSFDGAGFAALAMNSDGTAIWAAFNSSGQARWAIQDAGGSSPHILTHHYYTNGDWQGSANIYSTANKPTLAELGITSGTAALTAGSSPLTTGTIYIQYE